MNNQTDAALPPPRTVLAVAAVVFAVALALRLSTLSAMEASNPLYRVALLDESMYLEMARGERAGQPWFVAPLYPELLGALGVTTRHAASVVNCAIGSLTAALAVVGGAHLGRSLVGGVVAGALVALAGAFVFLDTTVATEPLVALVTLVGVLGLCRSTATTGVRTPLGAGLMLGLAALGRASALASGLGLLAVVRARRGRVEAGEARREVATTLAAFAAGAVLVLLAGAAWSSGSGGSFQPFPWVGGLNLHLGNGPASREHFALLDPRIPDDPHGEERVGWELAEQIAGRKLTSGEVSSTWARVALDEAAAHPGQVALHGLKKTLAAFSHDEIGGNHDATVEGEFAPWTRITPVTVWWIMALGVGGFLLARPGVPSVDVAALACVGHVVTLVIVFPLARYRLPIVPVCAVLAGAGAGALARRVVDRRRAVAAAAGIVLTALAAFAPLPLPPHAQACVNLGESLLGVDDDAANAWYERALSEDPQHAVAHLRLGFAALERRDNHAALVHYLAASQTAFLHRDAEIGAARALSNLGRHSDALARNDALRREDPTDATVAAEGALLALMSGRRNEAERRLAEARALDPVAPAVRDVEERMKEQ